MNIAILQKYVSQHQNAQEAHAQDALRCGRVIQGLVITSHSCVSQGKTLIKRAHGYTRERFW